MKRVNLSVCEMTTMKCIWEMGSATARRIANRLDRVYGVEYDEVSVQRSLKKLLWAGFIDSYVELDVYYVPLIAEEEFKREQWERALKLWRGRRMNSFVSGL